MHTQEPHAFQKHPVITQTKLETSTRSWIGGVADAFHATFAASSRRTLKRAYTNPNGENQAGESFFPNDIFAVWNPHMHIIT